jgi:hypothetical protein
VNKNEVRLFSKVKIFNRSQSALRDESSLIIDEFTNDSLLNTDYQIINDLNQNMNDTKQSSVSLWKIITQ